LECHYKLCESAFEKRENSNYSLCYLEEKAKADPLVVSVHLHVILVRGHFVHAKVRHLNAYLLVKSALDEICVRDPTVRVENIFWNIFGVNAVDRIANILTCGDNQGECQ